MALPAKPPAKPASEWGPTPPAGWGPDTAADTLEILTGLPIKTGGSVAAWEVYTTGAAEVAMGIWEKTGDDFVLKCVDKLKVKKAGFNTISGACSYSAGNYIGIGQKGTGKVVMNQALPGEGAGIVQFSSLPKPGETVGQKTPPFANGNSDCCKERQYAVKIRCSNGWGWSFLLFLVLASCSYVGGYVVYTNKVQGQPLALAVPHRAFWMEVKSLVEDGIALTKARALQARGSGHYTPLPGDEALEPARAEASPKSDATTLSHVDEAAVVDTTVTEDTRMADKHDSASDDDELVE